MKRANVPIRAPARMLPSPKTRKPKKPNTGVTLPEEVMEKLDSIVRSEGIKSRNALITSFLAFDVEFFPRFRKLRKRIEAAEKALGASQAEVVGQLVEMGLEQFEASHAKK